MRAVHSPLHERHQGGVELYRGELLPTYEKPERVEFILAALERAGHQIVPPRAFPEERLLRVHDAEFVGFLRTVYARWLKAGRTGSMLPSGFPARGLRQDRRPTSASGMMGYYGFDASTPIVEGTWVAVEAAAHCAMTAAAFVAEGDKAAYALCRPPGHHASRDVYGGYCFLNNAALAAQYLLDEGRQRVALLDVDYHHGNGTQDIFYERDDVLFVSIHGTPESEYPWFLGYADERGAGRGEGYNLNLPLPLGTAWREYRTALDTGLEAIKRYQPDALVVSLGVDTFEGDPISAFKLSTANYPEIGARIAALDLPTVLVQEGGYAVAEIGENVAGVLGAFNGHGRG